LFLEKRSHLFGFSYVASKFVIGWKFGNAYARATLKPSHSPTNLAVHIACKFGRNPTLHFANNVIAIYVRTLQYRAAEVYFMYGVFGTPIFANLRHFHDDAQYSSA
jgi:hypothetical protein